MGAWTSPAMQSTDGIPSWSSAAEWLAAPPTYLLPAARWVPGTLGRYSRCPCRSAACHPLPDGWNLGGSPSVQHSSPPPYLTQSSPGHRYFSGAQRKRTHARPDCIARASQHHKSTLFSHPPTAHLSRFVPLFLKLRLCLVVTIPSFNSNPTCLSEAKHRPSLS